MGAIFARDGAAVLPVPPGRAERGAEARLTRVHSFSTPGSFNYKKFLANQGIWITGWVKNPVGIIEVHEITGTSKYQTLRKLRYLPEKIRYHLALFLDNTLNKKNSRRVR